MKPDQHISHLREELEKLDRFEPHLNKLIVRMNGFRILTKGVGLTILIVLVIVCVRMGGWRMGVPILFPFLWLFIGSAMIHWFDNHVLDVAQTEHPEMRELLNRMRAE